MGKIESQGLQRNHLNFSSWKDTGTIINCTMCKHLEDNREVSKGQHELVENKTLQNSLMSTYNRVGGLVDRRQSIDY